MGRLVIHVVFAVTMQLIKSEADGIVVFITRMHRCYITNGNENLKALFGLISTWNIEYRINHSGGIYMEIDFERLREDLKQECFGAYFGGGFGGAMIEVFDVENASPQQLIRMAEEHGIDLREYVL